MVTPNQWRKLQYLSCHVKYLTAFFTEISGKYLIFFHPRACSRNRKRAGPSFFSAFKVQGNAKGRSPSLQFSGSSQIRTESDAQFRNASSSVSAESRSTDSSYGGSAKMYAGRTSAARRPDRAGREPCKIRKSVSTPSRRTFSAFRPSVFNEAEEESTNRTTDAPRLAASSPTVPTPAKRSAKTTPERSPRLSNSAFLARTDVGRTPSHAGECSVTPRAFPDTISIIVFSSALHCFWILFVSAFLSSAGGSTGKKRRRTAFPPPPYSRPCCSLARQNDSQYISRHGFRVFLTEKGLGKKNVC